MKPDWILIANATHARLLERVPGGAWTLRQSFEHPDSRRKGSELADDRAGREFSDRSFGGAAYEPRTDARRKEVRRFAQQLAAHLEQGARAHAYESLTVFASSPFLGELKHALGEATHRRLARVRDLDLTPVGMAELGRRIDQELQA